MKKEDLKERLRKEEKCGLTMKKWNNSSMQL